MATNINFDKKLGISKGAGITLPTASGWADTTSLLYDGVDDYQDVNPFSTIDGLQKVSWSMWIKVDSLPTTTILYHSMHSGGYVSLGYVNSSGMVISNIQGSGSNWTRTNTGAITIGVWHHVCVVYDETIGRYSKLKIYVDGVRNNTSNFYAGSLPTGTTMFIGSNSSGTNTLDGNLNEFAIWGGTALSSTEVNEVYNLGSANDLTALPTAPSPTNWYRSENANWLGSYYETADEMGNGAKLLTRNMAQASRVNDVPPNPFDLFSTTFDGIDDYISLASATPTMTSFSLSFWSYNIGSNYKAIVGHSTTGYGGLLVAIVQSGGYIQYYDNTTGWTNISGQNMSSWNHYIITFDGGTSTLKCYENGTLHTTINSPDYSAAPTNAHSFDQIGRYYNTGYYNSKLDEISIFDVELSASDVTSIYNSGVPNDISAMSGLVSFWRMGDGDTYPTITDNVGSNDGTMTNMSSANFVVDTP